MFESVLGSSVPRQATAGRLEILRDCCGLSWKCAGDGCGNEERHTDPAKKLAGNGGSSARGLGAVLFSVYIIHDTQTIVGGKHVTYCARREIPVSCGSKVREERGGKHRRNPGSMQVARAIRFNFFFKRFSRLGFSNVSPFRVQNI